MSDVISTLIRVAHDVCPNYAIDRIVPDTRVLADLGIDSVKIAELSLRVEQAFDITLFIPDLFLEVDDPEKLTLAMIASYIEKARNQQDA